MLAKDNRRIFYEGKPIALEADVESFDTFSIYGFARDKDRLYYFGGESPIVVSGADPDSLMNWAGVITKIKTRFTMYRKKRAHRFLRVWIMVAFKY